MATEYKNDKELDKHLEDLKQSEKFNLWWDYVGSGILPLAEHDMEEHARRVAYVAWLDRGLLISDNKGDCASERSE